MSELAVDLTFEEWLAGEAESEARHEFVGGRAYAMAGGTERHDLLAGLLYRTLAPGAEARGCRAFFGNRALRTPSGSAYYPDVMISCGRAANVQHEEDAVLLIEVRSPTTSDIDRREKAMAYAALPGIEFILLVDPDYRRIETARVVGGRVAGWDLAISGHAVFTPYGDILVDPLYDQVDATATT